MPVVVEQQVLFTLKVRHAQVAGQVMAELGRQILGVVAVVVV